MLHDTLADVISTIQNAERSGKKECIAKPYSCLIKNVLKIMQNEGYIGNFKHLEDGRGGKFKIELKGKINECKVIKPRYSVKKDEYIYWEKRLLPASGIGILIMSTTKGIVSHRDVQEKIGGVLVAYIY